MAKAKTKEQLNEFVSDDNQSQVPDANGNAGVNARPADAPSASEPMQSIDPRYALVNGVLNVLKGMSIEQLNQMYQDMMPYNNPGATQSAVGGGGRPAATPNQATLNPGADTSGAGSAPMPTLRSEAVENLFKDSGLSEEFKENVKLVFEVAVNEALVPEIAKVQDAADKKIEEQTAAIKADVTKIVGEILEGVDAYMGLVAEQWFKDNKIAIESGIKVQIGESVLSGLKSLAEDHSITVTETTEDIVSDLKDQIEESATAYNALAEETLDLRKQVKAFAKSKALEEETAGLTLTQAQKLKSLCENVDYENEVSFKKKVGVLKEQFIAPTTGKPNPNNAKEQLTEAVNPPEQSEGEEKNSQYPQMQKYTSALKRHNR